MLDDLRQGVRMSKVVAIGGGFIGLCVVATIVGAAVKGGDAKAKEATPAARPAAAPRTKASAGPSVPVTAVELIAGYEANEVGADARWKGRRLRVTGVAERVAKDMGGDPVVILAGAEGGGLDSVSCGF
jgi:hypothetical protein